MIYRWIIACYFVGWIVTSGIQFSTSGPRWLIYLTNWAIAGFVLYLVVAALSVTTKFITVHICKKTQVADRTSDYEYKDPKGCCNSGGNQLSWYQMCHWAVFAMFGEIAPAIVVLFWTAVYIGGPVDGVSANTHAVNGIILILDVFFFGVPVALLHVIYPMIFGAVYASFSGIYWAANGTNPANEERYIYPVLDYAARPTTGTLIVVMVVLLFLPFVHLALYALHLVRFWLVYAIYGHSIISCYGNEKEEEAQEDTQQHELESQRTLY